MAKHPLNKHKKIFFQTMPHRIIKILHVKNATVLIVNANSLPRKSCFQVLFCQDRDRLFIFAYKLVKLE